MTFLEWLDDYDEKRGHEITYLSIAVDDIKEEYRKRAGITVQKSGITVHVSIMLPTGDEIYRTTIENVEDGNTITVRPLQDDDDDFS